MSDTTPFVADHYDTLGVAKDANQDQIKKAFRKLARECHPDVAGGDPAAAARFDRVRKAYDVLGDPVQRSRYDRRSVRRSRQGPDGYRMPGGFRFRTGAEGEVPPAQQGRYAARRAAAAANNIGLEDIFGDFGDSPAPGAGGGAAPDQRGPRPRPRATARSSGAGSSRFQRSDFGFGVGGHAAGPAGRRAAPPPPVDPAAGRDISLTVDVPRSVSRTGGTVTLHYPRLRLSDDGRSVFRYDEIHDLRVPPRSTHGDTLRVSRMGNASPDGSCGDLVCDLRIAMMDSTPPRPADPSPHPPDPPGGPGVRNDSGGRQVGPESGPSAVLVVPISITEALLGGRVPVQTVGGVVRVTLPPCAPVDRRLRLRGKGVGGTDLLVELRIVPPRSLDAESRDLIEQFSALNPYDPRDD